MALKIIQNFRNITSVRLLSMHSLKPRMYDSAKTLYVFFRISGFLMTNRFKALYATYSLVFNFIAIILTPIIYTLGYFTGEQEMQINQFLTSLQMCISTYTAVIKFCVIIYMQRYLLKFEAIIDKLDALIKQPEEIREAEKAIKFGNRIVTVFAMCFYTYSTVNFVGSTYMGRPPLSLYNPFFNWRDSTTNLVIESTWEYILSNIAVTQNMINDSYAVVYGGMLYAHFKILIIKVLQIGTDPKCTQEDNKKELVRSIQYHKKIIELIETIKPVISATYFIQFLATAVCLGASLVNISISNDNSTFFGSAVYCSCVIVEIFPFCYLGNTLADESDRLSKAIFHMNWIDQSLQFRRMCLFFMHSSQQPVVFYAGKFFEISLGTFEAIIKCSFSVYTLLSTMNLAERFN